MNIHTTEDSVRILGKTFSLLIAPGRIQSRIEEMAMEISNDFLKKNPLFICVMNGAFLFTADLLRHIHPRSGLDFIRVSSYNGTEREKTIRTIWGLTEKISGRNIIILEDIIDSGNTISYLCEELEKEKPLSVCVASLLLKDIPRESAVKIAYTGFKIPDVFVAGYGMDYHGEGRNLQGIYKLINSNNPC